MDNAQRNPLLGWAYFSHSMDTEELRHSLLYVTLELETTRAAAREEIRRRDDQLLHLRLLLDKDVEEKEEALKKCQKLLLDNLPLTQKLQQQFMGGVSAVEDDPPLPPPLRTEFESNNNNNGFSSLSSSDSDESIVSSTLPEKGKLLQAVMKAGPLLQTLLLAGPLPQWRHPPPPLDPYNIPPVGIPVPLPATIDLQLGSIWALLQEKGVTIPPWRPSTKDQF